MLLPRSVPMMFPPSLDPKVKERSFHSMNGELGLLRFDVPAFLDACDADNIPVLGWEAWIVDHVFDGADLIGAAGAWSGLILVDDRYVVCGGQSPRTEIGAVRCDPRWSVHLRFNITI